MVDRWGLPPIPEPPPPSVTPRGCESASLMIVIALLLGATGALGLVWLGVR